MFPRLLKANNQTSQFSNIIYILNCNLTTKVTLLSHKTEHTKIYFLKKIPNINRQIYTAILNPGSDFFFFFHSKATHLHADPVTLSTSHKAPRTLPTQLHAS